MGLGKRWRFPKLDYSIGTCPVQLEPYFLKRDFVGHGRLAVAFMTMRSSVIWST